MEIKFNTTILEVSLSTLYARLWGREVYIEYRSGMPFLDFHKEATSDGWEWWAFGTHGVVSWMDRVQPA